ncbi:PilN domain-containing protein [uncultured Clostridium sp.]|uniref:PilN domain-containing protein n=1 Tax=uncultured Clostridium sp. TaxID=59620 RepID=UPI0028E6F0AA|nr:PilN domain-containing protein [uncultured Clostridium sp.]
MKDLNFFIPYQGRKKEKINSRIYIYGTMIIAAILILGTFAINTTKIILLDKSISYYDGQLSIEEIQEQLKGAETVNNQIAILKKYDTAVNDVSNAVKKRDNVSDSLLIDISSTVPSQISFKNLQIEDNVVTIKGVSSDRSAVAELEHNLISLSRMQNVYVNSIDTGTVKGEYSFDIKCVLKDAE